MNIILIMADTFRYDNLFDRAALPVRTPHLDAFSQQAVSLEQFYTGSFPTIPQRTDMISGRYGWPWYPWQPLDRSTGNSLPGILAQNGYVSQLICDTPHLFNARFQHVFTAAEALRGQEGDVHHLHMNHPIPNAMPPEKTRPGKHFQERNLVDIHRWQNRDWAGEGDRFPPRTAKAAVEWLEQNYRHDPFLLWVDFFDPHEPWDPPEYMVRKYDPDYTGAPMLHPNYGRADDYTPEELQNLRAHYCAEAELVDRWVGRILEKIDDLELWDNSIVVFVSDHGMSLGEHNRTGKSNISDRDNRFWPIYPDVAHILFLAAAPGLEGGRTVKGFAQPVDVLPSLLDLARVDPSAPEPFHGRSFAAALRGDAAHIGVDCAVSASFLRPAEDGGIRAKSVTPVLYTEDWTYAPIGPEGERQLFDSKSDPYAENDLAAANPDAVKALQERLIGWLRDLGAPAEVIDLVTVKGLLP
jgi:arylsulfatase A-like enzyme